MYLDGVGIGPCVGGECPGFAGPQLETAVVIIHPAGNKGGARNAGGEVDLVQRPSQPLGTVLPVFLAP